MVDVLQQRQLDELLEAEKLDEQIIDDDDELILYDEMVDEVNVDENLDFEYCDIDTVVDDDDNVIDDFHSKILELVVEFALDDIIDVMLRVVVVDDDEHIISVLIQRETDEIELLKYATQPILESWRLDELRR